MVGLSRFELLTPRLSSVCSNQLSYRPLIRETQTRGFSKEPSLLSRLSAAVLETPSELVKEPDSTGSLKTR